MEERVVGSLMSVEMNDRTSRAASSYQSRLRVSLTRAPSPPPPPPSSPPPPWTEAQFARVSGLIAGWRCRLKYKRDLKRARVRIMVIRELLKTEETYVSKLRLLTGSLRDGLYELLQNEDSIAKLLNNIQQIRQLNESSFLEYLREKTRELRFNTRVFDAEVLKIIPFFKIYSIYMQNYGDAIKYLDTLQASRKDIAEFVKQFEDNHDESVQSLLITPVQRLPRYRLLFSTLVEKTPSDHFDYTFIKRCLSEFEGVCTQVNVSIQKYLDDQKIFELAQAFKEHDLQLIEKKCDEERLTVLQFGDKECIVSILKDAILVSEQLGEEGLQHGIFSVWLSASSRVTSCEDMKYYQHIFRVSGADSSLMLSAESVEQKNRVITLLQQIIAGMSKQLGGSGVDNVDVNVLGTEEWNSTKIYKFTVYIAEVRISNLAFKIWLRYSQLTAIEKKLKLKGKFIQIKHLHTAFTWFTNHTTRAIEHRKILIESFLKQVLTSKEIRSSALISEVLSDLGLPIDFFMLPEKVLQSDQSHLMQSKVQLSSSSISASLMVSSVRKSLGVSQIGRLSASEVYQAYINKTKKRSRFSASTRFSLGLSSSSSAYSEEKQSQSCLVDISLLDGTYREVMITEETRCFEICEDLSNILQLACSLDFRVFLVDNDGNSRVLDDDEILFKVLFPSSMSHKQLQHPVVIESAGSIPSVWQHRYSVNSEASSQTSSSSIIQRVLQKLRPAEEKFTIVFKKYLWVEAQQEEFDIRSDPIRLNLISYQIFHDVHQQKFPLRLLEYPLFASLYLYITQLEAEKNPTVSRISVQAVALRRSIDDETNKTHKDFIDLLSSKVIPQLVIDSQEDTFWMEEVTRNMDGVQSEIEKIQAANSSAPNTRPLPTTTKFISTTEEILKEKSSLTKLVVFNAIKTNRLFGVTQFYVNIHKDTLRRARERGHLRIEENVWLGIRYDRIVFLGPEFKEKLFEMEFNNIASKRVFPKQIAFTLHKDLDDDDGGEDKEADKDIYSNKLHKPTITAPRSNSAGGGGSLLDFKFNTQQSYEISQLITEYQSIFALAKAAESSLNAISEEESRAASQQKQDQITLDPLGRGAAGGGRVGQ